MDYIYLTLLNFGLGRSFISRLSDWQRFTMGRMWTLHRPNMKSSRFLRLWIEIREARIFRLQIVLKLLIDFCDCHHFTRNKNGRGLNFK